MGKFSRLLQGKGKDITIDGEKYNIKPLSAKYLGLFMDTDKSKQADATFELVVVSLQQTDPEITKADVEELPIGIFNEVVETILDVNEINKG